MNLLWLVPVGAGMALLFAIYLTLFILRQEEGTERMREIARWVKEGARAYLKRQYLGVAIFFAVVFVILFAMVWRGYLVIFVPFAFLRGGFFLRTCGIYWYDCGYRGEFPHNQCGKKELKSSFKSCLLQWCGDGSGGCGIGTSFAHKAGVVGDTVGDPFKDTAGPSLNILIKLMSMVSIVFASLVLRYSLMK